MPELLAALDAFLQKHRRCGELDSGIDDKRVWMACKCGAYDQPTQRAERFGEGRTLQAPRGAHRSPASAREGAVRGLIPPKNRQRHQNGGSRKNQAYD